MNDRTWALASKRRALTVRAAVVSNLRLFFEERGFLEVETPHLIPAPAPEAHIEPVAAGGWFLHTSPEICMKRLLAAGYERIFQICRCFRAGERGERHLPEFTILEWYRAGASYEALMEDCEGLFNFLAGKLGRGGVLTWNGGRIDLAPPWTRLTVEEAFSLYSPLTLAEALRQDRFEELMVTAVEPHLGMERPVFLYEYPAPLAALARLKEGRDEVAERFELYAAGLELANAFSELTDPIEQRRRFEEAREEQRRRGITPMPVPEPFLAELDLIPPCAGIALGVDRLVMLFAGCARIDEVVAFPPESL